MLTWFVQAHWPDAAIITFGCKQPMKNGLALGSTSRSCSRVHLELYKTDSAAIKLHNAPLSAIIRRGEKSTMFPGIVGRHAGESPLSASFPGSWNAWHGLFFHRAEVSRGSWKQPSGHESGRHVVALPTDPFWCSRCSFQAPMRPIINRPGCPERCAARRRIAFMQMRCNETGASQQSFARTFTL